MRVIAVLATYNEELFIAGCLEHLFSQGVEVYLIDNCSTDATRGIAERYRGRGLVDIETFPRAGVYSWRRILERKQQLATELAADWIMHVDADEIHIPPVRASTLAEAFTEAERQGYNAVKFQEFTFIPTRESPDHEHPHYQQTMRFYYPFAPPFPHLLRAWKKQSTPVDLASSGGHKVNFPGLRLCPDLYSMRHYLFLSVPHAVRKYVMKRYDPAEVEVGWHTWRVQLRSATIALPSETELRPYRGDDALDASDPRPRHYLDELLDAAKPLEGH
jgi:glycosyltransferase involved in cell wall biosynthesis